MFLDEAHITVQGGKGGDGAVCWRREKYVPRGGPDGGDGGDGGDVIFEVDENTDTLSRFAEVKTFHAEDGEDGGRKKMHGGSGEDLVLFVPPGTIITDGRTRELFADLQEPKQRVRIAQGGRGGYGNAHFISSVRQAPEFRERGEPGETKELLLELKLIADVGIIGYPSVGKSTLISAISAAKPKIADYPFTTLVPNLGVVTVGGRPAGRSSPQGSGGRSFVVCDVPGLTEGASKGKGLGDKFLRHIERCGVLVHLLDASRGDLAKDYRVIRQELTSYSPTLAEKRELVVLNKMDLYGNDVAPIEEALKKEGMEVFASISAATTAGIRGFLNKLLPIVLEERAKRQAVSLQPAAHSPTILRPHLESPRAEAFVIEEHPRGIFRVRGRRLQQIAQMTDWSSPGAVQRFRDIAERSGLLRALHRAGADASSQVLLGDVDVSSHWL